MRLFILVLSASCVGLYGLALAGFAGYTFGRGRADYIAWGLSLGTVCGAAAIQLWRKWMRDTTPDMLIFDVDGVLIDTCDSYRIATAETVRLLWESELQGAADCEGYTQEYYDICKLHESFNDDAAVAWALLRCMRRTGSKSMKAALPSPDAWKEETKMFDGVNIEELAHGEDNEGKEIPLAKVRAVMLDIYYGKDGKAGLCAMEKPATVRDWKDMGLPVGIYTGRSRGEMYLGWKMLNWNDFPLDMLISSDEGILKPSPEGLSILCERAGAKVPLYFGDTASDKATWAAFGKGTFVAIGPLLKADATREGHPHYDTLESALSELLQPL